MMEQIDRAGQEEFIWAMRTRALLDLEEDSQSWRESKLTDYESSIHNERRKTQNAYEHHLKNLASFVPDEVLVNCNDYSSRHIEGCILIVDVFGFPELCEKYNKIGKGGTSRLTNVLNSYIGTLVQSLMMYNGDVIKFSGEEVMAFWKCGISSNDMSMQECIHQALDAALTIKKTHGEYETDVGVFLSLKLVISAGQVSFALIGNEILTDFVIVGASIWEAKGGGDLVPYGEIIISINAWDFINHNEYEYDRLDNSNNYVRVFGVSRHWRSTQRNTTKEAVENMNADGDSIYSMDSDRQNNDIHHNIFEIRPCIGDAIKRDLATDLRKYIVPTVLKVIDMNEGIENLTEMRNIVIVLMHVEVVKSEIEEYIKLVNKIYNTISDISHGMEGCLNKIFFNDKDLQFLVIFGLRGFIHELDSQRGLNCARRCHKQILQVTGIKSISASVTTGLSFCGVIGHNLRREYSVIGLSVNRAQKLLSAFTNKISCDRQTFFHSKLEARNFLLLDSKALKGVTNLGPIYEYVEFDSILADSRNDFSHFPILDRVKEITMYTRILKNVRDMEKGMNLKQLKQQIKASALVIFGNPRQGKTRLTEEILFCTPLDVPIFRIKLIASDKAVPYQAIRLLFAVPLGITDKSNVNDRELKITFKLKHMPVPELICVLNNIFKVNFSKTELFMGLSEKEKYVACKKTLKQLCHACFSKVWVLVLDGGEYIDDESWPLIYSMMETYTVVLVIAMASNTYMNYMVKHILEQPKVQVMHLKPIDKWFHIGLACQMLNVHGIPAELERKLHEKSNGNPGWIESYLISLLQSGELTISPIPLNTIEECPLIIPPKEMMARDFAATAAIEHAHSQLTLSNDYYAALLHDKWKIFKNSFRDSTTNIVNNMVILTETKPAAKEEDHDKINTKLDLIYTYAENKDSESYVSSSILGSSVSKTGIKMVPLIDICLITEGSKIDDIDPEFSLDVRIMKIYDSLTSYEQLLLKCSAVIGEVYSREMLMYVMNSQDSLKTAKAVQKLFEIGVLGCAGGKFTQQFTNAILNAPEINSDEDHMIICKCIGINTPDYMKFLPNYALCGYLRFKIPSFRETTYNILTLDQKKEYHAKAIRYLEKKTRKCISCGGGPLVKLMGIRYDQVKKKDWMNKRKTNLVMRKDTVAQRSSFSILENWETSSKDFQLKKQSKSSLDFKRSSQDPRKSNYSIASQDTKLREFSSLRDINKLKNRISLIRTYSDLDYNDCDCFRILDCMYKQLIEHCEGAEEMDKWLYAILEYSSLCINNFNRPLALKILFNALDVLEENQTLIVKPEEYWKLPYIRAKILTLIAIARFEIGQVNEAYIITDFALRTYGYKFPYKSTLRLRLLEIIQFVKFNYSSSNTTKDDYNAEYCDNVSECLNLMSKIFMYLGDWNNAELAAIWSLRKALESEKNFFVLINAYTNMICTALHNKKYFVLVSLEIKALLYSRCYRGVIEPNDLFAIYELYSCIFLARITRGELTECLNIGNVVHNIYNSLGNKIVVHDVLPLMVQVLLLMNKVIDAVIIITDMQYTLADNPERSGQAWYFALCISFHLDTGFFILPIQRCIKFLDTNNVITTTTNCSAEKRMYTALWLWCLRNEMYEDAILWKEKVDAVWSFKDQDDLVNAFTALYYMEALLLLAIKQMDKKNIVVIDSVYAEIDSLFQKLDMNAKIFIIIYPRLYHMKALYAMIKINDLEAFNFLRKGQRLAETNGNLYDSEWLKHSEMAWSHDMSEMERNLWLDHAVSDELFYNDMESYDMQISYYTLEPPTYL
ncbi:PREDICTED: adenylate cyclase type 10-like [Nicrophorus vespilloides]|uniref:Adenylate cyclase type 10-like n=1 Tax=Nicrophorus vespilloides TaxID=110193 RepID=A0ABM1NE24_NICVS|nr:PREDICTED: adenylate cyclase type 10-like [Nicrophorus vespilloides]